MSILTELRERANLSQSELGKLVGVTAGAISHYETERREISTRRLARIIKVLNQKGVQCSADDFLRFEQAA